MSDRVEVALVCFDFGEYCIRLAGALANQAEVLLLAPDSLSEPHRSILEPAVRYEPFRKPRYRQVVRQLVMVHSLLRRIRQFNPSLIHLQQGSPWFNIALPLLARYPLVVTVHDPCHHLGDWEGRRVPQPVYDYGFRRAAEIIVHGHSLRDVLIERLGIAQQRIHVIPHILLGDECQARGYQEDPRSVLFFGRIWEYKGLEYLIRAEPLISAEIPDVRIVIAGTGEDFNRYRLMMVHPERFEVHNRFVPDEERASLFARAAVVVLPYVDASQSGVIPLAYTFSKPVVATTVGSLPEVVDQGITGYLVPPRDERALAEAVLMLLRDESLRRRMGAAGKRKIESEAAAEKVADLTLEVYRQALGIRTAPT